MRIAVPDTAAVKESTDFVLPIGQAPGTRSFSEACMTSNGFTGDHPIQRVVVIYNEDNPAATLIGGDVPAFLEFELPPGDRLVNLVQVHNNCAVGFVEYDIYEAEIAGLQSGCVAMVLTFSSLTENHEAVMKSGASAYGVSEGVAVAKGEKPVKIEMICNIELLPGDRLIDFVELDHDPKTGETIYACWLEY